MFGRMNAVPVVDLRNAPDEIRNSCEGAVARLLDATEHPRIEKWVQLPKAVFLFLVVRGDSDSGAFYVYDRRRKIWYWVDFDDDKFGGYTIDDFERLVRECHFLDIVERPDLLVAGHPWIVELGARPRQSRAGAAELA